MYQYTESKLKYLRYMRDQLRELGDVIGITDTDFVAYWVQDMNNAIEPVKIKNGSAKGATDDYS